MRGYFLFTTALIGAATKTSRGFESQAETIFPENSGDPGHSGLSVDLSWKKVELTLDANSSAGKRSRFSRSKNVGFSDPTTNFYSGRKKTIRQASSD